jgi:hypothetical protein
MSAKLTVGLTKKLGLRGFGSVGARCDIELMIGPDRIEFSEEEIGELSERLYAECRRAVEGELARCQEGADVNPAISGDQGCDSNGIDGQPDRSPKRLATIKQVRALSAIAFDRGIDLREVLRERFGEERPENLGIRQASKLIEELKSESVLLTRS